MMLILVLLVVTLSDSALTHSLIFEEEFVTIHSGLSLETATISLHTTTNAIRLMNSIQFENDLLQKQESHLAASWDILKQFSTLRLSNRLHLASTRLLNLIPLNGNSDNKANTFKLESNDLSNKILGRDKRSIEILGDLISYVTGVPGPREWRLNQQNILHLKNAITKLINHGKNQESRITTSRHQMSVLNSHMIKITNQLNETLGRVNIMEQDFKATIVFRALEIGALNAIECIESFLTGVERIVFKGMLNLASLEGIDTDFLKSAIIDIQASEKILTPIYGTGEIERYYEVPLTTVTKHGNEIWSTMKIPLVNYNRKFERVWDISPIVENLTDLSNLGLNSPVWFRDSFDKNIFLGLDTLEKCLRIRSTSVCESRAVEVSSKFTKEGGKIENFWSETENHGYIGFINQVNTTVQLTCGREKIDIELGLKGLIFINDHCSLRADRIHINKVKQIFYDKEKRANAYHLIDKTEKELNKLLTSKKISDILEQDTVKSETTDIDKNQLNFDYSTETIVMTGAFDDVDDELNEIKIDDKYYYSSISSGVTVVVLVTIILVSFAVWKTCCSRNNRMNLNVTHNKRMCDSTPEKESKADVEKGKRRRKSDSDYVLNDDNKTTDDLTNKNETRPKQQDNFPNKYISN
jgi:hypothetical protein